MNVINLINMMEFRIGLMRHYIAQAFICEMKNQNGKADFVFNNIVISLTPDRVSANIATYIERKNIQLYGIFAGQEFNATQLNKMLELNFMAEFEPQLSSYGVNVMKGIYKQITIGGEDGILPVEADIKILAGDINT